MNVIRPHTMGKFKDLLMATAKSPAMLVYLDNFQSMSPDTQLPQMRRGGQLQRRPGAPGNGLGNPRPGQDANDPLYRQQQIDRQTQRDPMRNPDQMTQQQRQAQAAKGLQKRKAGSTRTMLARSWSFIRWGSRAATLRRMCRK